MKLKLQSFSFIFSKKRIKYLKNTVNMVQMSNILSLLKAYEAYNDYFFYFSRKSFHIKVHNHFVYRDFKLRKFKH